MSAGLPGLGLGGLFFIFSALLAPVPELWQTLRGRSSLASWRVVGRQFAQAAVMVVAVDLTIRLIYLGLSAAGHGDPPRAGAGTVLPLMLIGITSALLGAVIGVAKLAELTSRVRAVEALEAPMRLALPRSVPSRALGIGGAMALTWLVFLAGGASAPTPLDGKGQAIFDQGPDEALASLARGAGSSGHAAEHDPAAAESSRAVPERYASVAADGQGSSPPAADGKSALGAGGEARRSPPQTAPSGARPVTAPDAAVEQAPAVPRASPPPGEAEGNKAPSAPPVHAGEPGPPETAARPDGGEPNPRGRETGVGLLGGG